MLLHCFYQSSSVSMAVVCGGGYMPAGGRCAAPRRGLCVCAANTKKIQINKGWYPHPDPHVMCTCTYIALDLLLCWVIGVSRTPHEPRAASESPKYTHNKAYTYSKAGGKGQVYHTATTRTISTPDENTRNTQHVAGRVVSVSRILKCCILHRYCTLLALVARARV